MEKKMNSFSFGSADRNHAIDPAANDYAVEMPSAIQRVREVRLGSARVPMAAHTVEKDYNDTFYYCEGIRVDVGEHAVRLDTFPWTPGNAAPVQPLWNNQLLIAERDATGAYSTATAPNDYGTNNHLVAVPAWLNEVEGLVTSYSPLTPTAASSFFTVPAAAGSAEGGCPHGLLDYQAWKASGSALAATAPRIVGVAMCTFRDIEFSSAEDVIPRAEPSTPAPHNVTFDDDSLQYTFHLTPAVVGDPLDATVPSALNAFLTGEYRSRSVEHGFIHCPALQYEELCDFLTFSFGRRRTLNKYRFHMQNGRVCLSIVGPVTVHPNGMSTAPRLFFATTPNAAVNPWGGAGAPTPSADVAPNGAGGGTTSLGALLGFQNGGAPTPSRVVVGPTTGRRAQTKTTLRGTTVPHFAVVLPPGQYDPEKMAAHLGLRMNWGASRVLDASTASAVPFSIDAQFVFGDTTGALHTVGIRKGHYFPFELAKALEYAMDRLDRNGAYAETFTTAGQFFGTSNNLYPPSGADVDYGQDYPSAGNVKYSVEYSRASGRFTFTCRRIVAVSEPGDLTQPIGGPISDGAAAPVFTLGELRTFSMTFTFVNNLEMAIPMTTSKPVDYGAAPLLGFDLYVEYAGKGTYTGAPVDVPSMRNTLSQGPLNSAATRPLMERAPGTANGYGCGPWARLYPSNAYALRPVFAEPRFGLHATTPRAHTELEAALRGSRELQVRILAVSPGGTGVITELATVPTVPGQNYAVGQLFYVIPTAVQVPPLADTAVGMVVGVGKRGEVKAVSLVYRGGVHYVLGVAHGRLFAPQGSVRVIHGSGEAENTLDTLKGKHRLVVSTFHTTEAPPTSECLFVTNNPDTTVATACTALSRPYRTTTAPFGHQVGDVVRICESEVLRTNEVTGTSPSTAEVTITATIPGLPPGGPGPIGGILTVTVTTQGSFYVAGMFVAVVIVPPQGGPPAQYNNAILRITRVSALGAVLDVDIVYAGSGYNINDVGQLCTVMGPYAQTAVVIESMNSGCCWNRAAGPTPPLWPVELASGRVPAIPIAAAANLGTKVDNAAAYVGRLDYAFAGRGVDGATLRVRVAEGLFYNNSSTIPDHAFTPFGQYAKPGNLDLLGAFDRPRFEILVKGKTEPLFSLPRSVGKLLGTGTDNMFGATRYTFPHDYNFGPDPYILLRLVDTAAADPFQIHVFHDKETPDLLAKLIINQSAYVVSVKNQILAMNCGGLRTFKKLRVQLQRPDGSPYPHHGLENHIALLFVYQSGVAQLTSW